MTSLKDKTCVPCEGGVRPFSNDESEAHMKEISNRWKLFDKKIIAEFTFKNFREAVGFVNRVAELAEQEGHHPDIEVHYNKVKLILWTHAIGGLSENDFILAAKIDEIL